METILAELIEHLSFGSVLAVVVLLVAVAFYYNSYKPMAERTRKADCPGHGRRLKEAEGRIRRVEDDVLRINTKMSQERNYHKHSSSMKKSPRRLNAFGEEVYNEFGGAEYLAKYKDHFFAILDEREPHTAYDVENEAYDACVISINDPVFYPVKNYLYNAPTREVDGEEYETTMGDMCTILGLSLRDMYLEAHPEIQR